MEQTKVVFTYHAMDRVQERFPEVTKIAVMKAIKNPSDWMRSQIDFKSGTNKGDGVKLKVDLKVEERRMKVVTIKKVEENRPTYIVLSVHA